VSLIVVVAHVWMLAVLFLAAYVLHPALGYAVLVAVVAVFAGMASVMVRIRH